MQRLLTLTLLLATAQGMLAQNVQAAVTYRLDTLAPNEAGLNLEAIGLEATNPDYTGSIIGDFMWLNGYTVQAGGDRLKSLSVLFGAPSETDSGFDDWQTNPAPISLFLYGDPNNDGNPNDARLLAQADTFVSNPNTTQFTTVDIPTTDLAVGSRFFVGALLRNHRRDQRPATYEYDAMASIESDSWYSIGNHGDYQPSNFNAVDLASNYQGGPFQFTSGQWVLRAIGESSLPPKKVTDPSSAIALLGLGLWVGLRRRDRL